MKLKKKSYLVGGIEHPWFSEPFLGQSGVAFALEPQSAGEDGRRHPVPCCWKGHHMTCPASGLEEGSTKRYVQSSVEAPGSWRCWAEACWKPLDRESRF